jgi:hypothetical protein
MCGTADDGHGDGVCDSDDNCPTAFNPDQADSEGGIGPPRILAVGYPPSNVEQAVTSLGGTLVSTFNFFTADLTGIDVVLFYESSQGYFTTDVATKTKLAAFVSSGGGLYVELGGGFPSLDYSWVPQSGVSSTPWNREQHRHRGPSLVAGPHRHPIQLAQSSRRFPVDGGLEIVLKTTTQAAPCLAGGRGWAGPSTAMSTRHIFRASLDERLRFLTPRGDGVGDACDNCRYGPNPDRDSDGTAPAPARPTPLDICEGAASGHQCDDHQFCTGVELQSLHRIV